MTALVPADQIEALVGARRHPVAHLGRAAAATRTVYILHSQECKDSGIDLRDCGYSLALDRGIDLIDWQHHQDQVVTLQHVHGHLMPDDQGPPDIELLPERDLAAAVAAAAWNCAAAGGFYRGDQPLTTPTMGMVVQSILDRPDPDAATAWLRQLFDAGNVVLHSPTPGTLLPVKDHPARLADFVKAVQRA